ncbi:hypothetical protein MYAM1_003986 [Malassezia yamatoensis]|uniref:Suppressor of disruption of TFIIS n=1 Tax=Malassezia yamatoensis TaxID=253288 RepID=A0AAJ5YVB4_9BASI|nr:hypothetical protein MYAM1_003986 [Malassezia yamatoensis]
MQQLTRSWRECVGFQPLSGYQEGKDANAILWLDIDNTLYSQVETRYVKISLTESIPDLMADRIRDYFKGLGLSESDAEQLHSRYYKEYGLAIRGLVKHHTIDPMDYDEKCDRSLPLEQVLKPDPQLIQLLQQIDQRKVRIYALTNAYKAVRMDPIRPNKQSMHCVY